MGFFDSVGAVFTGIGNKIVSTATDIRDVGAQVGSFVLDTGKAALDGAHTLITDPVKFASDVRDIGAEALGHVHDSVTNGAGMIAEGWNDVARGGNPGLAILKTVGGLGQIASFGVSDAIGDHVADSMDVQYDELGNISHIGAKEGTDAITRIFLRDHGDTIGLVKNANDEIEEALEEGDADKANEMFGQAAGAIGAKAAAEAAQAVATAAAVGSVVVGAGLAPVSGGTTLVAGITASQALFAAGVAGTAGGIVGEGAGADMLAKFNALNVADDAEDQVAADIAKLGLEGEAAEQYRESMGTYYRNASYDLAGSELGASQGYGSNEELKAVILAGGGFSDPDALPEPGQEAIPDSGQEPDPEPLPEAGAEPEYA